MFFRIGVCQPNKVAELVDQELCSRKSLVFVNVMECHTFLHISDVFRLDEIL